MFRNLVALTAGILLTFALTFAGAWLAWLLIVGSVGTRANPDAVVRLTLWQMFCVVPLMCVVVSSFVASVVRRSAWLLGGVAVLPMFVYGLIRGAHVVEIVLFLAYVGLALATAFGVSRFKRPQPA